MRFLFPTAVLGWLGTQRAWASVGRADTLLAALNQALARGPQYDGQRLARIAALRTRYQAAAAAPAAQFSLGLRIYDEYKAYKYDSAFAYCLRLNRLAVRLGDPGQVAVAQLRLAFILLSSGMFKETFDTLNQPDARRLAPDNQLDYYFLLARAYRDLGTFNQDAHYRPADYARSLTYADTAARLCHAATYQCLTVQGLLAQKHDDLAAGLRYYRAVPGVTPHQVAVSASTLASIYAYGTSYEDSGQDDADYCAYSRAGDSSHQGLLLLLNDGGSAITKTLASPWKSAMLVDKTGSRTGTVTTDANGNGSFPVNSKSWSVWVVQ